MRNTRDSFLPSKPLDYFLQLTDTMNYTQASQILGITQPALTQQIKKLEERIGAPLFYSVGKQLYLSDAGYTLLGAIHQIYEIVDQTTDQIQQSAKTSHGQIDIGILSLIEPDVFTEFGISHYKAYPNVEISFHILTRNELWKRLEENRIDIGIIYFPDSIHKRLHSYVKQTILHDELVYLGHCNSKSCVKLKEVADHPCVSYPQNYYLSNIINEQFRNAMLDPPKSVAHFTQSRSLYRFAQLTNLSTILPRSCVCAYSHGQSQMQSVSFNPQLEFELSFVYRKGKERIPRILSLLKEFDEFLKQKDYVSRLTELNQIE